MATPPPRPSSAGIELPKPFLDWFASKGWQPRAHQLDLLARAEAGKSTLLIAPTGAGKTLAGFLPTLVDLARRGRPKPGTRKPGIHTLYISPLKALAVDIHRNLSMPVDEMGLPVEIETRTGDTPQSRRQRQKLNPPDILLTTPEQLALLLSHKDAESFFADLRHVVLDELHSLVTSKRGHLLALGLARLHRLRPGLKAIGLSATVAEPDLLRQWLVPQRTGGEMAELVTVAGGAKPEITILESRERVPWSGHSARYAMAEVYEAIRQHRTTLLFVNTRSQAELLFQELWRINEDSLPIALHHGSLDVSQRRRVEQAMQTNSLRAIVATSTLDLGIDWGDVDLVVHVGSPKGASRLAQRIGRANHRMDEASKAILVPANRFEVMECQAALDANYLGAQDTPPLAEGALDVLCQHILGMACSAPFRADDLYSEVTMAAPYANLPRETFDRAVQFVAHGGYALQSYERYARIRRAKDGTWRVSHPSVAQQYRLNCGTIIEAPMLNIRLTRQRKGGPLRGGPVLGKIEEGFIESLVPGDTFLFAGKVLQFEGIRENDCFVSKASDLNAKVPAYAGGKFPTTTYLSEQVRRMLSDPDQWRRLPHQVSDWLRIQKAKSAVPGPDELLVETFPRANRFYMVAYPFEGRLAHQTLCMLLTRRLERAKARPLGFVASDYAVAIWGLRDMGAMLRRGEISLAGLFDQDMLGDDLEAWLDESYLLKRTFRSCATIAGLIEKRHPGKEKSGRQMTVSADLIYDVLRSHEPDHILLQATRADARGGLLDIERLGDMLARIRGHIVHRDLDMISPLAVPVMLEIGKEPVHGDGASEALMAEAADDLIRDALGGDL
ncbi:ligase-associated DNA damage response DEXH box helicase [Oricola thermophila]|uniref:Ligase-associated DNA damage response DEXH box helicase n=1 Tax=Oricola thermophila TaxID=2742145 RepID=A0A6N1VNY7_9HYPH|nr:ligase-associated DNA damage response DEXH box helicase [Oricola thermophila]QKV20657.1 ligase-associated DNA damage response DEXH box helicase [Oricola thermophila]